MATLGEYLGAGSGTTKLLLHLNGNFTDSSGNGNNPTNSGMVFVDGKFGKVISTEGTTSRYASIASALGTTFSGDKTISFWTKLNAEFSGADKADNFVSLFWDSNNAGFAAGYRRVSNVNYLTGSWIRNGTLEERTQYAVNLGTSVFHHVVVTASSGRVVSVYLNGVLVTSFTGTSGDGASQVTDQFRILNWVNVLDCMFDEIIVETGVWSAEKVKKYYTYAKGRFGII